MEGRGSAPPHAYHLVCDLGGRGDYGRSRAPLHLDLRRGGPRPRLTLTTMSATWREGGRGGSAPAFTSTTRSATWGNKERSRAPKSWNYGGGAAPTPLACHHVYDLEGGTIEGRGRAPPLSDNAAIYT